MNPQKILEGVPTDAPSSTTKPKNNLWSWVVGVLAIVGVTLWGVTQSLNNDRVRAKDVVIADKDTTIKQQRQEITQLRQELQQCYADKLLIQSTGQQQLLEYLDIQPGKRQTISISPKKHQ